MNTTIFAERESNVRSYCRSFPAIFTRAKGALLYADSGQEYIDFLAGAGALNYGHNNEYIKRRLLDYLAADGITQGLDLHTEAKAAFLEKFTALVLAPRGLDYKVQFCGPTGANAVEAALKLARKVTGRSGIFSFMGAYHGMSLGSLAVTSNLENRAAAGVPLDQVSFMPFPHGFGSELDTIRFMEQVLTDSHSGIEKPAAIIFESVQAEGGVIVAPTEWLQQLRALCDRHDILLICDDIQVGCYRTGSFFSFERAGIVPDMVILSKSISGYGLPMALVLLKPHLDRWKPAEHTGTFRGNQLAFVGASAALDYIEESQLAAEVDDKSTLLETFLRQEILPLDERIGVRGLGMIWGVDLARFKDPAFVKYVATRCYELGLIVERVGRQDAVIKLLPPLTIETQYLVQGCTILQHALKTCLAEHAPSHADSAGTRIFPAEVSVGSVLSSRMTP